MGQIVNLRRIVNPPAALGRARRDHGESPTLFATCRYVGQIVNLRPSGTRPACLSTDTAYPWLRLCCLVGQAIAFCGLSTLQPVRPVVVVLTQLHVYCAYEKHHSQRG